MSNCNTECALGPPSQSWPTSLSGVCLCRARSADQPRRAVVEIDIAYCVIETADSGLVTAVYQEFTVSRDYV